ncbi:venom protease-like [Argonauta hians]
MCAASVFTMLVLPVLLAALGVQVRAVCENGVDFPSILNTFYYNSDHICRNTTGFIQAMAAQYCCTFDAISCPVVSQLTRHYYGLYEDSQQLYYLCIYNTFTAISSSCDCHTGEKAKCGVRNGRGGGPYPELTTYIVGGTTAEPCEFPWMAFIRIENIICGGSLIDNKHILTAAHCVHYKQPEEIVVSLGTNDNQFTQRAVVSKVTTHPYYREYYNYIINDVAILTLRDEIKLSWCISPICLPDPQFPVTDTQQCYVTGWGKDAEDGLTQRYLHKVRVPLWNATMCEKYVDRYSDGVVCAGYVGGGKDSCGGDSGGPLICPSNNNWVLTGIVSFGKGCSRAFSPGVYTDVSYYLPWIQQNLH